MKFIGRLKDRIRGYFLAGLLIVVPLGVTLFVITAILRLMDRVLVIIPPRFHPHTYLPLKVPGLGLIFAIFLVILAGILVKNYIGRRVVDLGEYLLSTIPLVRPVYAGVKQLVHGMFGETQDAFKRVVLIEYPRKGAYTLAFVTGLTSGEIQEKTPKKVINVFVPTTPNPTSGFYLMVPVDEAIPLSMTVEDAFKLLISGGMVAPAGPPRFPFGRRQRLGAQSTEQRSEPQSLEASEPQGSEGQSSEPQRSEGSRQLGSPEHRVRSTEQES